MGAPEASVNSAEADIPAVRVPGLSITKTTSKVTPPSLVIRSTLLIFSTVALRVVMVAGMEIWADWPTEMSFS